MNTRCIFHIVSRWGLIIVLIFYSILSIAAVYNPSYELIFQILSLFTMVYFIALSNVKLILNSSNLLAESNFAIISFFVIFLLANYNHSLASGLSFSVLDTLVNSTTAIGFLTTFTDFVTELSKEITYVPAAT
mgnify:FL=1